MNHTSLLVVLGSLHSLTHLSFVVVAHSRTESWGPKDQEVQSHEEEDGVDHGVEGGVAAPPLADEGAG